jgi:hypothetical protein
MPIPVTDRITRGTNNTSPFAVAWEQDMKVSFITVASLIDRDAIEEWRRLPYMTVKVTETGKRYSLGADITIAGQVWEEESTVLDTEGIVYEDDIFDSEGYIRADLIKNVYLNESFVVDSEAEMLALTTLTGNFIIRTDTGDIYVKLNNDDPAAIDDFSVITHSAAVISVNGEVGIVEITISSLLAVAGNLTAFNTAVTNNSTVANHTSAITNLTARVDDIETIIDSLTAEGIPLTDGDKGDITVAGGGINWTLNPNVAWGVAGTTLLSDDVVIGDTLYGLEFQLLDFASYSSLGYEFTMDTARPFDVWLQTGGYFRVLDEFSNNLIETSYAPDTGTFIGHYATYGGTTAGSFTLQGDGTGSSFGVFSNNITLVADTTFSVSLGSLDNEGGQIIIGPSSFSLGVWSFASMTAGIYSYGSDLEIFADTGGIDILAMGGGVSIVADFGAVGISSYTSGALMSPEGWSIIVDSDFGDSSLSLNYGEVIITGDSITLNTDLGEFYGPTIGFSVGSGHILAYNDTNGRITYRQNNAWANNGTTSFTTDCIVDANAFNLSFIDINDFSVTAAEFFLIGVDAATSSNILYYDTSTGEITYGAAPSGGWALTGTSTLTGNVIIDGGITYDITMNMDLFEVNATTVDIGTTGTMTLYGDDSVSITSLNGGISINSGSTYYVTIGGNGAYLSTDEVFLPLIPSTTTSNIVYYNTTTGRLTYGAATSSGWAVTGTTALTGATTIDGNTNNLTFTDLGVVTIAGTDLVLSGSNDVTISAGTANIFIDSTPSSYIGITAETVIELLVTDGIDESKVYASMAGAYGLTFVSHNGIKLDSDTLNIASLPSATASSILYYDSVTGEVSYGTAPSAGGGLLQREESGSTYTIQNSDNGYTIYFTATCTVTIPHGLDTNHSFTAVRGTGGGTVTFVSNGTSTLRSSASSLTLQVDEAAATWNFKGTQGATTNIWYGFGEFGTPFLLANGNGTTANSTSIDIGGTLTENTAIDGAFTWVFGGTTPLTSFEVNANEILFPDLFEAQTDKLVYYNDTTGEITHGDKPTRIVTLGASGSGVVATGVVSGGMISIPFAGTIVGWRIDCYPASTMTLDLWKIAAGATPTNANSITAAAKPSVTAGTQNDSSSVGTWTGLAVAVDDKIAVEVEANSAATHFTIQVIILPS